MDKSNKYSAGTLFQMEDDTYPTLPFSYTSYTPIPRGAVVLCLGAGSRAKLQRVLHDKQIWEVHQAFLTKRLT